jgi:hypothetical protein
MNKLLLKRSCFLKVPAGAFFYLLAKEDTRTIKCVKNTQNRVMPHFFRLCDDVTLYHEAAQYAGCS